MNAIHFIGLLLSITTLIFLICKGYNAVISSIVAALVAGLTNGFGVWESLTGYYVPGFMGFASKMFFVFLLATVYGKVIGVSGSAHRIAYSLIDLFGGKRAILVIGITTGILVYGGVSAMVVVFTILPIAFVLFREADIPKALLPATITWGQATFAFSGLPGSPQNPNIVPTTFFGTTPTAGPVLGIVAALVMFILGWLYLEWQNKRFHAKGVGFDPAGKINLQVDETRNRENCPSTLKAFAPLVSLLVIYLLLADGALGFKMNTINAVNTAMFISIVLVFVLNPSRFSVIFQGFLDGTKDWITPLFNFTCMIAFGAVVQATPGFARVSDWLLNLPGSVYVSAVTTTSIMCGITGNGSGGETIALNAMADKWLAMGANPDVLHRIVCITSSGLDSLPHCGGITTVHSLCDESVGKQYIHSFFTTTLFPLLAAILAVILAGFGIC